MLCYTARVDITQVHARQGHARRNITKIPYDYCDIHFYDLIVFITQTGGYRIRLCILLSTLYFDVAMLTLNILSLDNYLKYSGDPAVSYIIQYSPLICGFIGMEVMVINETLINCKQSIVLPYN